ncbi:MAG: hypothetical protein ACFFAX_06535 [Promethearchaeota archaeon]
MSSGTKASFLLGAIGGFLIATMYIPVALGLAFDYVPWNAQQYLLILILARILVSTGIIGLWRKSGNVIPLISAIFIILWVCTYSLLWYLDMFTLLLPVGFAEDMTGIATISAGVGWITAGISAWMLREEFSRLSIVATLVFIAFGAVTFPLGLMVPSMMNPPPFWWYGFASVNGIVAGIYFLDATRT